MQNIRFTIPQVSRLFSKVWYRNRYVFIKTGLVNFIPPILEPILYLFAFGLGLGLFIREINGVSYIRFLAPALIAISIMYGAFFECTFASFVRMYYQKTFDAILATPLNLDEIITGEIVWGATKSFINATIMTTIITLFGYADIYFAILALPVAILGGLLFASLGMFFTSLVPTIDTFNVPIFIFITPMFLFSNTFFPVPGNLAFVSQIFPLTHTVELLRAITYGSLSWNLSFSVIYLLVGTLIFYFISVNLMRRRLIK